MRKIPLFEPNYGDEEKEAILDALDTGFLNEGKYVREFEERFANYVGAKHCILVPNGALALWLAIKVSKHNLFKIPDYYGIFAADAVRMANMTVELVDVENNGCVGPQRWNDLVIPIHANGRTATVCDAEIEDCGQAPTIHTPGLVSCYSFHSTKLITCGGIGGAVCTDDKELYLRMSAIKDHGRPERAMGLPVDSTHVFLGTNLKMPDICAAFGIEQLKKLKDKYLKLANINSIYQEILGDKVQWFEQRGTWRVDCLVDNPDKIITGLAKEWIGSMRFYKPTHQQAQFKDDDHYYPNTMELYNHGIYLPSSTTLTDEDIHYICEKLLKYVTSE